MMKTMMMMTFGFPHIAFFYEVGAGLSFQRLYRTVCWHSATLRHEWATTYTVTGPNSDNRCLTQPIETLYKIIKSNSQTICAAAVYIFQTHFYDIQNQLSAPTHPNAHRVAAAWISQTCFRDVPNTPRTPTKPNAHLLLLLLRCKYNKLIVLTCQKHCTHQPRQTHIELPLCTCHKHMFSTCPKALHTPANPTMHRVAAV